MTTCATCKHWGGDPSTFMAACANPESAATRMPFDGTCSLFEQRGMVTINPVEVGSGGKWVVRPTCPMCHSSGAWVQHNVAAGYYLCLHCSYTWQ
jgi:hypothetical protein